VRGQAKPAAEEKTKTEEDLEMGGEEDKKQNIRPSLEKPDAGQQFGW